MQIKKQRFYVEDVAIDVFYERNMDFSVKRNAVVSLCGFPDFAGPNDMTTYQVELGNIVFQPHMKGTFDSAGFFGPEGIKETLEALNAIIFEKKASEIPMAKCIDMPWIIKRVILIGHSFGGMIQLRYFHIIKNLDSIIFISPAVHYAEKYGCDEDGPAHYAEVAKKYPFTYRLAPANSWGGILEGRDPIPENCVGQVNKVAVIYGSIDKYFDVSIAQKEVPNLVKSYIKSREFSFDIIDGAGHPLGEILSKFKARTIISGICKGD